MLRTSLTAGLIVAAATIGVGAPSALAQSTTTTPTTTVASAPMPTPTVEGPIPGKPAISSTTFDLASVGYEQSEFFVSGTASSYTSTNPLVTDGTWTVTVKDTSPYKTRILVIRPTDASKFNGTVVVEWLNVTSGMDSAPDWIQQHVALIRDGYAWVGVSAQQAGIDGIEGNKFSYLAPKPSNPARYGSLSLPKYDNYSYDIFTQAGNLVREQGATILGGLTAKYVLAEGESQSAFRLVTYVDAVAPTAKAYDAYFIHSRGNLGAPLYTDPSGVQFSSSQTVSAPNPTLIRADLDVPVITFSTETDLYQLGYLWARQPDSKTFRSWEVPGTAHADSYTLGIGSADNGDGTADVKQFQSLVTPTAKPYNLFECGKPINGGQQTYVLRSAIEALDKWAKTGTPPPGMPRVPVDPNQPSIRLLAANAMVRGGIRTPALDAPIATLAGVGQSGSSFCFLFGTTEPYQAAKLAKRYPSHSSFTKAWDQAVDQAVKAGTILAADAANIKSAAAASDIGK